VTRHNYLENQALTGNTKEHKGIENTLKGNSYCSRIVPAINASVPKTKSADRFARRKLFGSQGNHRIDFDRPARWEVACQQRDAQEQYDDHDERERIGRADPVQQIAGQAGHSESGDQTGEQTDDGYSQSLTKNEFENIAPRRSDGNANA
jgi:hypothetical protein